MNASEPEAGVEYSRGHRASRGDSGPSQGPPGASAWAATGLGVIGAALLIAAEFTPLAHLASSARGGPALPSLGTGSHDSYALIPLALLAGAFSVLARSERARLAMLAVGALGVVALGIALIGDLPAAQASGLIHRSGGVGYVSAAASPAAGFYLETLGGVVLLIAAATGVLLLPGTGRPRSTGRPSVGSRPERSVP